MKFLPPLSRTLAVVALISLGSPNQAFSQSDLIKVTLLGTGAPAPDPARFGPATLVQQDKEKAKTGQSLDKDISITFSKSGKKLSWDKNAGSLLEFAEAQGVDVDSGCRAGSCGSCLTMIESGEVEYNQQADADVEPGHCLLCITRPKNNLTLAA